MPKNEPAGYKTEEQLKRETRERREAEAALAALKPKTAVRLKCENFWYHYKWHTVIGTVLLIAAAFFVKDILFRVIPDATVVMISGEYFSVEETEAIAGALEQIASDRNGDKKVLINVDFIALPYEMTGIAVTPQQDYANMVKLTSVFSVGADPIFILDEAAYNHIMMMSSQDGASQDDGIFSAGSVSAGALGLPRLDGMRLYLMKGAGKDEEYYDYCGSLLQEIDRR